MATMPSPVSAAPPRLLADALPSGHPSCHAQVVDAAELAAQPGRRVAAISIERSHGPRYQVRFTLRSSRPMSAISPVARLPTRITRRGASTAITRAPKIV